MPPAFVKHFNLSTPNNAILKAHTEKQWHVTLEEGERGVFLTSGWQRFASENSLELGDFLVFNYDGNSHFDVTIFGIHGCKKEATSSTSTLTTLVKEESKTEPEETLNKSNHARKLKYSNNPQKSTKKLSLTNSIIEHVASFFLSGSMLTGPSGAKEVRSRRTAYSEISGEFDWHEFEARQNNV